MENQYGRIWTLENATPYFEEALNYAENSEACLSIQDAIFHSGMPYSTFYYLADHHSTLEKIKEDIGNAVIRRVNRIAIIDKAPPAPCIWRMKQCGEKDSTDVNQKISGSLGNISEHRVIIEDYTNESDIPG